MKYEKMLDGMFRSDLESLCHLLLLKRDVDGLNGRTWSASRHFDYEDSIKETLARMGMLNAQDNQQVPLSDSSDG
jgi:hypothetical protein